jgi:hypothetical protein
VNDANLVEHSSSETSTLSHTTASRSQRFSTAGLVWARSVPPASLEDLHNGAVFGPTGCDGMIGRQAFGAEERNMFASQSQQVRVSARFGFVGCDDDGATGFGFHKLPPLFTRRSYKEIVAQRRKEDV